MALEIENNKEKLLNIDSEIQTFFEDCKHTGFNEDEIIKISQPLLVALKKARVKKYIRHIVSIIISFIFIYFLLKVEFLQWHLAAISRILLIKVLPFWRWQYLSNTSCLINYPNNPINVKEDMKPADCLTCEAVTSFEMLKETDYDTIVDYMIRGIPVIVTDANENWPSKGDRLDMDILFGHDFRLKESIPCIMQTNIRNREFPTGEQKELYYLFKRIERTTIGKWFWHFQNCELEAVKVVRYFVPRPYFFGGTIPPATSNWVLISDHYPSPNFKHLNVTETDGIITMFQLKGDIDVELNPKKSCQNACKPFYFRVSFGDTLVIPNSLWEISYRPYEQNESITIVTESEFNE